MILKNNSTWIHIENNKKGKKNEVIEGLACKWKQMREMESDRWEEPLYSRGRKNKGEGEGHRSGTY